MFCFIVLALAISISWGGQGTSKSFSAPSKDKDLMEIYKFFHFIKEGDLQQLEKQLDAGCNLKKFYLQENCSHFQKSYRGMDFLTTMQHVRTVNIYPIFFAICYHQPEIVKQLLQKNVDVFNVIESVNLTDEYKIFDPKNWNKGRRKYTALEVAAYYGDSDMVQILYKYMNEMPSRLEIYLVDDRRKFNLAFINAIKSENTELVSWFLEQGAEIRTCEKMFDAEKNKITYGSAVYVAQQAKNCVSVIDVLSRHISSKNRVHLHCNTRGGACSSKNDCDAPLLSASDEYKLPSAVESQPHNAILSFLENEEEMTSRAMHVMITEQYNDAVKWKFNKVFNSVSLQILMHCDDHISSMMGQQ